MLVFIRPDRNVDGHGLTWRGQGLTMMTSLNLANLANQTPMLLEFRLQHGTGIHLAFIWHSFAAMGIHLAFMLGSHCTFRLAFIHKR